MELSKVIKYNFCKLMLWIDTNIYLVDCHYNVDESDKNCNVNTSLLLLTKKLDVGQYSNFMIQSIVTQQAS